MSSLLHISISEFLKRQSKLILVYRCDLSNTTNKLYFSEFSVNRKQTESVISKRFNRNVSPIVRHVIDVMILTEDNFSKL